LFPFEHLWENHESTYFIDGFPHTILYICTYMYDVFVYRFVIHLTSCGTKTGRLFGQFDNLFGVWPTHHVSCCCCCLELSDLIDRQVSMLCTLLELRQLQLQLQFRLPNELCAKFNEVTTTTRTTTITTTTTVDLNISVVCTFVSVCATVHSTMAMATFVTAVSLSAVLFPFLFPSLSLSNSDKCCNCCLNQCLPCG